MHLVLSTHKYRRTHMAAARKPQKRSMACLGSYLVGLLVALTVALSTMAVIYEWQQLAASSNDIAATWRCANQLLPQMCTARKVLSSFYFVWT